MKPKKDIGVLLVEDSAMTAEQLREVIKTVRHSLVVSTVATQTAAVAAIEKSIPDVVVLDLLLKEGSGFGLLRDLALVKPKPGVIVITNYALPKYREYAFLVGADYFLDKARNFDVLPSVIESLIAKRLERSPD